MLGGALLGNEGAPRVEVKSRLQRNDQIGADGLRGDEVTGDFEARLEDELDGRHVAPQFDAHVGGGVAGGNSRDDVRKRPVDVDGKSAVGIHDVQPAVVAVAGVALVTDSECELRDRTSIRRKHAAGNAVLRLQHDVEAIRRALDLDTLGQKARLGEG